MKEYYKDPARTAETIQDGWVRTGDKGRIDEDGFLFIMGRVKEIFKTAKGKYVAPGPIENRFVKSIDVEQLCLTGNGLNKTVMLVTLSEMGTKSEKSGLTERIAAEMNQVNEQLASHEVMSQVIVCKEPWTIENRLLTHTMKIKRSAVDDKYEDLIQKCGASEIAGPVVFED